MEAKVTEFHWDRARLKRSAVLCLLVGTGGLATLIQNNGRIQALGIAVFTVCAWFAYRLYSRVSDTAPVVTVSAIGLRDRRIKPGLIPWTDIALVEGFAAEHVPFIGLDFHDPRAVLSDARPLARLTAPMHRLLRRGEDLLAAIRKLRPDLVQAQAHERGSAI